MDLNSIVSPPLDRLRVFVSSTIDECAQERAIVREAIRSINHEPILFEDVGARPYPPREVYKPRLEASHIFVAIYRNSYGSIAPEIEISGIEDEFRIASERGMDRLIYIHNAPESRDPRLEALIEAAKNSPTVVFYTDPEELRNRVRADVTAVVSERFINQAVVSDEVVKPEELIESMLPDPSHLFRRPDVERSILDTLRDIRRLIITAPLGAGKTILIAQLATENKWIFVDGQGLSSLELLARSTNTLRLRLGYRPIAFTTERAARQALLQAWEALQDETLAVDGTAEPQLLWQLPSNSNRLVLTSRVRFEVPVGQRLELPPLGRDEIDALVTALRGNRPDSGELAILVDQSEGNPLYLRFYALGQRPETELSLRELEVRAFQSLSPRAREIVSYLTLAGVPLSLHDLEQLSGEDAEGPESVADLITEANVLVRQSRRYLELVHEHPRETLLDQLHHASTRLGFFASRLGTYLEQSSEYVAAYHVYEEAGERRHADLLVDRAAHQAAFRGGGAPGITIFRHKAEQAHELGQVEEEVLALLTLAQALQQTGVRDEAGRVLHDARSVAQSSQDTRLLHIVREIEIMLDLQGRTPAERIAELEALREAYVAEDKTFDAARLSTFLSAEHIVQDNYELAEQASRGALEYFTSVGDQYGIQIARINLASALSGMDNGEKEASEITRELDEEMDPSEHPRERAVICNILTRRHRHLGNTNLASTFAEEAIQIGKQLGNLNVIAINHINLGNVHRDEGFLDKALDEYRAADRAASQGGFRSKEASANELIASVLNEQGKHALAATHAQHAASMARLVGDLHIAARADEERAVSFKAQNDIEGAAIAYMDAANAMESSGSDDSFFVSLVGDGLSLCSTSGRVDLKSRFLVNIFAPDLIRNGGETDINPLVAMYAALPGIARRIRPEEAVPVIALAVADLLEDAPERIERRIILQSINALLKAKPDIPVDSALMCVVAILMACSWESLPLSDLADVAERIVDISPRMYFKPHPDGAGHWTARLELADGVVVTVSQFDDSPQGAVIAMTITLLLVGLSDSIRRGILEAEHLPRCEVIINVTSRAELDAKINPAITGLDDMPSGFAVTSSTDITSDDQPPIIVIYDENFGESWHPNRSRMSDVHMLFAQLLRGLAIHLLAMEIEPEVLYPKIAGIIRQIGYWGDLEGE